VLYLRADRGRRRRAILVNSLDKNLDRLRYAYVYAPHGAIAHKNILSREMARIWRVGFVRFGQKKLSSPVGHFDELALELIIWANKQTTETLSYLTAL